MSAKFDKGSFNTLGQELSAYRNDVKKKPNGILTECIRGLEKALGKSPQEFLANTSEEQREALKIAIQRSGVRERITDVALYSLAAQQKNRLRAIRNGDGMPHLDATIVFANTMGAQLD